MRRLHILAFLLLFISTTGFAEAAYMDVVEDYSRGLINSDTTSDTRYADLFDQPGYAVDGRTDTAFNLGIDGWMVLGLSGRLITNGSQIDITVHEFGAADEYEVLLGNDGVNWENLGQFGQTRDEYTFELSNYSLSSESYRYLKIVDFGGPDGTASPGAELAMIEVSNFVHTPVPAAVWLLATGLTGVFGLRARRR